MALKSAMVYDILLDYLLGEGKHASYDRDTVKRLESIETLDNGTKSVLFNIIDTYLRDATARKAQHFCWTLRSDFFWISICVQQILHSYLAILQCFTKKTLDNIISTPKHIRKKSGSTSTEDLTVKNFANTIILKTTPVKSKTRNTLELFTFSLKKDIITKIAMSTITIEERYKKYILQIFEIEYRMT
jgi:hypothetical protein